MKIEFTPYVVPVITAVFISLMLAVLAARRRPALGAAPFAVMMAGVAWWSATYMLELMSVELTGKIFWAQMQYIGAATVVICMLLTTLALRDDGRRIKLLDVLLLAVVPLIVQAMVLSNGAHELIWQNVQLVTSGPFSRMTFDPGTLYWVNVAYLYLLLLIGYGLLVQMAFRRDGLRRRQALILLTGGLVPSIGHAVYVFNPSPIGFYPTPVLFAIAGVILGWGLLRHRLLDVVPIARDRVVESISDAVVVLDTQNYVLYANHAAVQMLGVEGRKINGLPAGELFAEWSEEAAKYRDVEHAQEEITIELEDGIERTFSLTLSPLRGNQGELNGRVIVLRDITERKEAEEALRSANDRLTVLRRVDIELSRRLSLDYVTLIAMDAALRLSGAENGFIALGSVDDNDLKIVRVIGAYADVFDDGRLPLAGEGILGRALTNMEAQWIKDVSEDPDYRAVLDGIQSQITVPLISSSHLIGVLNLETKYPERFSQETFESLSLLATQVASAIDNSRMYEERERLVEELDAYAHTVAHDLKNPMGAILGYLQVMLEEHRTDLPEGALEYVERINFNTRRGINIIDSLLMLAGVRTTSDVRMSPLDMLFVVTGVLRRLSFMIEHHKAEIKTPDRWPLAAGFGPWVEEVWVNYVSNALKYGGSPPIVELGVDPPRDGMVRFWVRDNGEGIAPADIGKLFHPFAQIGNTKQSGHGLGLSIVRRIIDRLGGEVGVESKLGKGSKFWFTLPATDVEPIDGMLAPQEEGSADRV